MQDNSSTVKNFNKLLIISLLFIFPLTGVIYVSSGFCSVTESAPESTAVPATTTSISTSTSSVTSAPEEPESGGSLYPTAPGYGTVPEGLIFIPEETDSGPMISEDLANIFSSTPRDDPASAPPPEDGCCCIKKIVFQNTTNLPVRFSLTGPNDPLNVAPRATFVATADSECIRISFWYPDPSSNWGFAGQKKFCCEKLSVGPVSGFPGLSIVSFEEEPCPPEKCLEDEPPAAAPTPEPEPTPTPTPQPEPVAPGPTAPGEPTGPEGPTEPPPTTPPPIGVTPPDDLPARIGIDITESPDVWLPRENNTVTYTAKIYIWVGGQGWMYPGPPRTITFTLSGVSNETGVCLNKGDQTTPDLYFKSPIHGFNLSGGEGTFYDTAETWGPVTTATITVTSDDFGSFGKIKSSAPGCEDIEPNGPVSIPWDDNDNTIADIASQDDSGAPPEKDKETQPTLDGYDGDGYSNYEEYRGFFVQDVHVRNKIDIKDLLINDRTGKGIGHYSVASGVVCHLVKDSELKDRVANFNRGHATTGAQHGIIMQEDSGNEIDGGGRSVQIDSSAIGPPRNVQYVIFDDWTARRAAHELGHSTCVQHHGSATWSKTWIYAPEDNDFYNNSVSGWIRRRWRAARGNPPLTLCGTVLPAKFRFHPKGAQQSGDVGCVIKYYNFFEVYSDNDLFGCWPADVEGTTFCTSPTGTSYNAGGLVGGNASRGDCKGQLRVNDK